MKKLVILLLMLPLLVGCSARETFETVDDLPDKPAMGMQKSIVVDLPSDAYSPVTNITDGSRLYFCDEYELSMYTLPAGDLNRTIQHLCGYDRESVAVVQTKQGEIKCYKWAWSSAGEAGDQVGRAVVLDDGSYHYCVCVMSDAAASGTLETLWTQLLSSVTLA